MTTIAMLPAMMRRDDSYEILKVLFVNSICL